MYRRIDYHKEGTLSGLSLHSFKCTKWWNTINGVTNFQPCSDEIQCKEWPHKIKPLTLDFKDWKWKSPHSPYRENMDKNRTQLKQRKHTATDEILKSKSTQKDTRMNQFSVTKERRRNVWSFWFDFNKFYQPGLQLKCFPGVEDQQQGI